jgi:hypothetical protein
MIAAQMRDRTSTIKKAHDLELLSMLLEKSMDIRTTTAANMKMMTGQHATSRHRS